MTTSSSGAPSTRQVLLGLLVLWQLFFLVASNFISFFDESRDQLKDNAALETVAPGWAEGEGHLADACSLTTELTERWSQLTGQTQGWSLFASDVWKKVPFLALEYRWEKEPWPDAVSRHLTPLAAE